MLPPISTVLSVEMIRDGGSLSALFLGANGSKYCLHFELKLEYPASGDWIRLGYENPVVFEYFEFRTEAGGFAWEPLNKVEISWDHARVFLNQMRAYVQSERDIRWLEAMTEVAVGAG